VTAAAVGAVAVVALLLGGGSGGDPPPVADAGGGSAWTSPCPDGGAATVCIESVAFVRDDLAVSFRPRGVELSVPPLQGAEVAPVFFLTAGTADDPDATLATGPDARRWGPASPMQGQGVAGDSGWSSSTLPTAATAVCVALFDAAGSVRLGSGNCASLPS